MIQRRITSKKFAAGFTLIELLVTLVILGILASAAIPMAELAFKRNKEEVLRKSLDTIRDALDAYKQASVEGHIATEALDSGYPPNLTVLVEGVEDALSPNHQKIYFLRRIPVDPFIDDGAPSKEGGWGKRSYRSEADHPQAGEDVYDVYSRSMDVGVNGIPYRLW